MRKLLFLVLPVAFIFVMAGLTMAVGPAKKVEYDNKAAGKVVMDGKAHADKGLKCAACHPKLYKMKAPFDKITMADLNAGKSCAIADCHDGKKAFGVKDCAKCHKK